MSRKIARIGMMQTLFAMNHKGDYSLEMLNYFLEAPSDEEEALSIHEIYKEDKGIIVRDLVSHKFIEKEKQYIRDHVPRIVEHLDEIDNEISTNLKKWTLERLAQVDLAILRVAVYEFLYCDDIPLAVSINEAIDMAKNYSTLDSSKFINGILGTIARKYKENDEPS